MSQDTQQAFLFLGRGLASSQGCPEDPLVARDQALDLPALPVQSSEKAALHLAAVTGLRPLAAIATVDRDDCGGMLNSWRPSTWLCSPS